MYFYLSFLRPPPLQALISTPILITPQVSNDLRTELYQGEQDIFYSWSQCTPATSTVTKPTKMTTWRRTNAYKEIPMPPPPGVRDGQAWRLVLYASVQGTHTIRLGGQRKLEPFPVMSMPIQFSSNAGKGNKGKQETIDRVYLLPIDYSADGGNPALLTVREHTAYDLDKKIWDSGIGLSAWLVDLMKFSESSTSLPHSGLVRDMKDALLACDERNILELGAGTGIVALTLAALRSSLELTSGQIISTDLPSAIPLMEHNISSNAHIFLHARPEAAVLDWDTPELPPLLTDHTIHAIIMADVTYNTDSFPALIATLALLVNVPIPPLVLLGYKERDSAERTLWDLSRKIGLVFECVGDSPGMGGQAVEIWVGRMADQGFRGD